MKTYRATKRLASLKKIITSLEESNLLTIDDLNELKEFGNLHQDLLERQLKIMRQSKTKHVSAFVQRLGATFSTFAIKWSIQCTLLPPPPPATLLRDITDENEIQATPALVNSVYPTFRYSVFNIVHFQSRRRSQLTNRK